jgi:hypothetical protein
MLPAAGGHNYEPLPDPPAPLVPVDPVPVVGGVPAVGSVGPVVVGGLLLGGAFGSVVPVAGDDEGSVVPVV